MVFIPTEAVQETDKSHQQPNSMVQYSNSKAYDSSSSSLTSCSYSDDSDSDSDGGTSTAPTEYDDGTVLRRYSKKPVVVTYEDFDYVDPLEEDHERTRQRDGRRPSFEVISEGSESAKGSNVFRTSFEGIFRHDKPTPRVEEYRVSFPGDQRKLELTTEMNDPRSSWSTYASSYSSADEHEDEVQDLGPPDRYALYPSYATPSEPPDFAEHFPSTRRLHIRHDDATLDGNMNLRVDTIKKGTLSREEITLFHLRMVDLQTRNFSLRRYGRYSGREVCHSKLQSAPIRQSVVQRTFRNALTALGFRTEKATQTEIPLRRHDSGYHSIDESLKPKAQSIFENSQTTTSLEFSNYAHVDVHKIGVGRSKHYDFEFWGERYSWKRYIRRSSRNKTVSFRLYRASSSRPVAHIVPECLTAREAYEEEIAGGWIPPSSLYISDRSILGNVTDVAEVVVATGLIALVDDCIQRSWQPKGTGKPNLLGRGAWKMMPG